RCAACVPLPLYSAPSIRCLARATRLWTCVRAAIGAAGFEPADLRSPKRALYQAELRPGTGECKPLGTQFIHPRLHTRAKQRVMAPDGQDPVSGPPRAPLQATSVGLAQ